MMILVHGDDYVSAGEPEDLNWLEGELKRQYEIKTQRAGRYGEPDVEVKVLNRIIRRTHEGYEMEADPRHAELICGQLFGKCFRIYLTSFGIAFELSLCACFREIL